MKIDKIHKGFKNKNMNKIIKKIIYNIKLLKIELFWRIEFYNKINNWVTETVFITMNLISILEKLNKYKLKKKDKVLKSRD